MSKKRYLFWEKGMQSDYKGNAKLRHYYVLSYSPALVKDCEDGI